MTGRVGCRFSSLFSIRLALCEKALAEYLETKRLAFPRFYFVSSADLLDILSNGNEPVEVGAERNVWQQALHPPASPVSPCVPCVPTCRAIFKCFSS